MKKTMAILMIAVFILSLVPVALADGSQDKDESADSIRSSGSGSKDAEVQRLQKIEEMKTRNAERLQKMSALNQRQIEKLSELNVKNVDKIAKLSQERLRKLGNLSSTQVERLSELNEEKLSRIADLDGKDLEKLASMNRGRLDKISNDDISKLKNRINTMRIKKVRDAEDLAPKNLTEGEKEALKEKYEAAKERFKNSKEELESIRDELKSSKERRNSNETLQHAKEYLARTADYLISHLEKVKIKVQESTYISDEKEAEILAQIDSQIEKIKSIKAEAEAATTKEQVKSAAKKLRAEWKTLKQWIRFYSERVISARVEGIVNRADVLEKRLDKVMEKAAKEGVETNLSGELGNFSAKIELAKEKYSSAQSKLAEAWLLKSKNESSSDSVKSLVDEANALLKEARTALKDAHDILKDIVRKLKAAYPETDLSEDTEVEVVQESDVEAAASA